MQIQFVSLDSVSGTGIGSVFDFGTPNTLNWSSAWLNVTQPTGNAGGSCNLEYSLDNSTWVSVGHADVRSPISITYAEAIDGNSMPYDFVVTARYLRANLTTFSGTGTLTATIVVNG